MPTPRRGARVARQLDQRKMRLFELEIIGRAYAKGRPRVTRYGTFTPEVTRSWEERVGAEFMAVHGAPQIVGPVAVRIVFNQKSGDLDNLAKAILDGLNGVAFVDDSQVCQLHISRPWEPSGRAHTFISVEEIRG